MGALLVGVQNREDLVGQRLKVPLDLHELRSKLHFVVNELGRHRNEELAHLGGYVKHVLNRLEHFLVVEEALLDDLLQVRVVHLGHFLKVRALLKISDKLLPEGLENIELEVRVDVVH